MQRGVDGRARRVRPTPVVRPNVDGSAIRIEGRRVPTRTSPARRSAGSAPGLVAGTRQVKRSQTYTASRPSTSAFPASSGTSSDGPTATTLLGANGASAARATSERTSPTIASSRGGARWRSRAQSAQENARGNPLHRRRKEAQDALAALDHRIVAPDPAEAHEHRRHHRVPGRDRIVVEVLRAGGERLAVVRREEEPAALVVREELDRAIGDPARLEQPAHVAGRDVELDEAVGDVRVVVEEAAAADPAVADAAQHAAVLAAERPEKEVAEPHGGLEQVVPLDAPGRLGERRESEAVPGRDRLVVAKRLRPLESADRAGAPSSGRRGRRARSSGRARTARASRARARAPPSPPASRCRSVPRCRPCRRPAPRRSRRWRAASRAVR